VTAYRPTRTKREFLGHVEAVLEQHPNSDAEGLVREVFKLLARRLSKGEIDDVKHILPPEVRALWPLEPSERGWPTDSRPQRGRASDLWFIGRCKRTSQNFANRARWRKL